MYQTQCQVYSLIIDASFEVWRVSGDEAEAQEVGRPELNHVRMQNSQIGLATKSRIKPQNEESPSLQKQ